MKETKSINDLKNPLPDETNLPEIAPGFGSLKSFELMQRAAKLLITSTILPAAYRAIDDKKGPNPNALANCVVALNMSHRMNADPIMVMQNLYVVEGRPSWSSQWIIAAINGCGRFSPLRFDIKSIGEKSVDYVSSYWSNGEKKTKTITEKIKDKVCVAWAIEKGTGERIESPPVTIEMAVLEGWYSKNGSKWKTMDEVMLRYRTASFFGKLYAPELLMGLQTVEELHDARIIDAHPDGGGGYSVDVNSLKQNNSAKEKNDNQDGVIDDAECVDDNDQEQEIKENQVNINASSNKMSQQSSEKIQEEPTQEEQAAIKQQLIKEAREVGARQKREGFSLD